GVDDGLDLGAAFRGRGARGGRHPRGADPGATGPQPLVHDPGAPSGGQPPRPLGPGLCGLARGSVAARLAPGDGTRPGAGRSGAIRSRNIRSVPSISSRLISYQTYWPRFSERTSPAASRICRCLEIAGLLMANLAAISPAF